MSAAAWAQLFVGLAIFTLGYVTGIAARAWDERRDQEAERRSREHLRSHYDRRAD